MRVHVEDAQLTCNFQYHYKGTLKKRFAKYEKYTPANEATMCLADNVET